MVPLKRKTSTKVHHSNGRTTVKYHNTPVVTFSRLWITLDTGGWKTATTKARMNQASQEFNLGFYVFQQNHNWYVTYGETTQLMPRKMFLQRAAIFSSANMTLQL